MSKVEQRGCRWFGSNGAGPIPEFKLRDFIRELIALRADYPVLCRKNFLTGASTRKAAGL